MIICKFIFSLDLNMELPQGQTGSVGASVASTEQVEVEFFLFIYLFIFKFKIWEMYDL